MQDIIQYFIHNQTALYICVALLGLCVGSFLNVVIYRTVVIMNFEWEQECQQLLHPEQAEQQPLKAPMSLSFPASHCPHCQQQIRWYHNIPIFSWIMLAAKCQHCQHPISIRYPFIELLSTLCSIAVVYVYGPTWAMLCGLGFTWILIVLTFIDFDSQLLPDRYTLPLAAAGLLINSLGVYHLSASEAIWGYVIGFLCLWVVYYAFKLVTAKEGMGYGDFKLLAALGAWLGPFMLPLIVLLSSFFGAIIGLVLLKIRKESQPFAFGPYIAIAGWIAFLWGETLMKLYLDY